MPLSRKISLLRNFTTGWAGEVMDDAGIVRILNANGTRLPLIWCFNAENEFPALAAALGPDQPVIGLRSLNIVVNYKKKHFSEDIEIAQHYAQEVLQRFQSDAFWIGGNCQGAAVAASMADAIVRAGKTVPGLFLMEWAAQAPWPGPCHFLYGAESQDFNPFVRNENPWPRWQQMYTEVTCDFLPGDHGQYFMPEKVGKLASLLTSFLARYPVTTAPGLLEVHGDEAPATSVSDPSPLSVLAVPKTVVAGSHISLEFKPSPDAEVAETIHAMWLPHEYEHFPQPLLCPLTCEGGIHRFRLETPSICGSWTLRLFRCRSGTGPLQWSREFLLEWTVAVT